MAGAQNVIDVTNEAMAEYGTNRRDGAVAESERPTAEGIGRCAMTAVEGRPSETHPVNGLIRCPSCSGVWRRDREQPGVFLSSRQPKRTSLDTTR